MCNNIYCYIYIYNLILKTFFKRARLLLNIQIKNNNKILI